jgi:hypothetical protein
MTAVQVKSLLQRTARRIGPASAYNASGHSTQFGYGCVNALAAVTAIAAAAPPAPAVVAVTKPRVRAART